jgi:hypothetical protein
MCLQANPGTMLRSPRLSFGANPHAATYSGAPAVGMGVNGLNLSGNPAASVRGIVDIVNGGNAGTRLQWTIFGMSATISAPIALLLASSAGPACNNVEID